MSDKLERLASTSPYAFGIVLEAKMAALVQMIEHNQRDVTKEQFLDTCERMWDKYCISNKGRAKK